MPSDLFFTGFLASILLFKFSSLEDNPVSVSIDSDLVQ